MISIASAMKQEEIITLLEAYQGENETFTFKEKNGIKLFFENYDLLSLTTGIFFIGLGGYLFFKGKKVAEEEATKDEVKR